MGIAVTLDRLAPRAGLLGSTAIAGTTVIAGIAYRGIDGEPYSPLNHYVSELGEVGVSSLAAVFNSGLIVGGLCFAVFMVGLGGARGGIGGVTDGAIGAIAGLAGTGVGIFPMNDHDRHVLATFLFFNLGWLAIALASVDILARPDPGFPARLAVLGLAVVAAFIGFIGVVWASSNSAMTSAGVRRPAVDAVTVFEWAAIAGILIWTFVMSTTWQRSRTVNVA